MIDDMMTEGDDFDSEMEGFACLLLKDAKAKGVSLADRIKVMDSIQPYFAAREKYRSTKPPSRDGKPAKNFAAFKSGVNGHPKEQ